jgi:acetyltransferase-like isoleucine patch superfamily enzyme
MKRLFKIVVQLFILPFPWIVRKMVLQIILNIEFEKGSKIGYSVFLARKSILRENAVIKNFTFVNEIDFFEMGAFSKIGNRNWITGSSSELNKGYKASPYRKCEFIIGEQTRITANHHFDCNGGIYIGKYTTIAGMNTQILTHGIDLIESVQKADRTIIGNYCFVGTRCIILKGAVLPNNCLLAAGAVLTKNYEESEMIYAGVPAKAVKKIPIDAKYFFRKSGNVN